MKRSKWFSKSSDEIKESGLEFSIDSISVTAVDSSSYVNFARPSYEDIF